MDTGGIKRKENKGKRKRGNTCWKVEMGQSWQLDPRTKNDIIRKIPTYQQMVGNNYDLAGEMKDIQTSGMASG